MDYNNNLFYNENSSDYASVPLYKHIGKTYAWMFLGLLITFLTSFVFYESGMVYVLFSIPYINLILIVAKLALVCYLSARIYKLSVTSARVLFLTYSFTTGIVFSSLFLLYDVPYAIFLFLVTAAFFGLMALIGLTTKKDLSGFGSIILFGLIALVIMGLVSSFFNSYLLDVIVCFVGIFIFLGVTIYDSQKAKNYYYEFQNDSIMLEKLSIYSALDLYLDFINIFIYLLRLFGKKK